MTSVSKWMVVPFVKPIERPVDSKIQDLDGQMSTILVNPKLDIHDKIKMYAQQLAKFDTYFDQETNGLQPIQPIVQTALETLETLADKESVKKVSKAVKGTKKYVGKQISKLIKNNTKNSNLKNKLIKKRNSKLKQDLLLIKQHLAEVTDALADNQVDETIPNQSLVTSFRENKGIPSDDDEQDNSLLHEDDDEYDTPSNFKSAKTGDTNKKRKFKGIQPARLNTRTPFMARINEVEKLDPKQTNIVDTTRESRQTDFYRAGLSGSGLWFSL